MATEWKRGTFTFDAVGSGHTSHTIMRAIENFLVQCGWERASWNAAVGSPDTQTDRYYLRRDRYQVNLENDAVGTAGNVAITKSGTNISVNGMLGGIAALTKASGGVLFAGQPADADTVTISDGTTSVIFEFDSNSSVTGGRVAVTIGVDLATTIANFIVAVNANAFNVTATAQNPYWLFNGDGPDQFCGIRVLNNTGSTRIDIYTFLENTTRTGSQLSTNSATIANITVDSTAPNNYLFIGGLYGLYVECGRDGTTNNLGHMAIVTWEAIPEFYSSDDAAIRWTTMGAVLDLFGTCKFSEDRNSRFVDNAGSNKNYTSRLAPYICRGTSTFNSSTQVTDKRIGIGPRDNFFAIIYTGTGTANESDSIRFTFGIAYTPRNSRYRISTLMIDQTRSYYSACSINSSNASNTLAGNTGVITDVRAYRQVKKFVAADGSLLPFVDIIDAVTSIEYHIAQIADNGRTANIGIEWPSAGNVVTISGA